MLTQRVRVAESRIENSSANGPPRVRSKGWVLKRVLDEVGCNWSCSEGGCCGIRAVVVEFKAVAVEFRAVVVEFRTVAVRFRGTINFSRIHLISEYSAT